MGLVMGKNRRSKQFSFYEFFMKIKASPNFNLYEKGHVTLCFAPPNELNN